MKLNNTNENEAFKSAIKARKGDIWLESSSGDRYNLKSVFSQYIALGAMLSESGEELELFCSLREDETNFFRFFREYPEAI